MPTWPWWLWLVVVWLVMAPALAVTLGICLHHFDEESDR